MLAFNAGHYSLFTSIMKMKKSFAYAIVLLLTFGLLAFALPRPEGGRKTAYKQYYKGNYYFGEGDYKKAVSHFQQAYDALPNEFNFAMALGVGLGTTGKTHESLALFKKCRALLNDRDPEQKQKQAMISFFEGVAYCYGKMYNHSITPLKTAISLQEKIGKPRVLSVMYNTLGYATLLNQGKGAHKSQDKPMHIHLRKDDLQAAVDIFAKALKYDGSNEIAGRNYHFLGDTLDIPKATFDTARVDIEVTKYNSLPNNSSQMTEFTQYDEVVLLLDISGSMVMENVACRGVTRFQVMKETAMYLLDQMPATTKVGIGTIGGDCGTTPKLWYAVDSISTPELRTKLEFLVPDGTTPLLNILVDSPKLFSKNENSRKAILLVSDGANICKLPGIDICDWAVDLKKQNTTINVISFLNADLDNANAFAEYTCLADNTYGKVLYIDAYNCRLTPFSFQLLEAIRFRVPRFQRVNCWGKAFKDLWAVFPE